MSSTKRKILLLLFSGLEFGYSITPGHQWRVLKNVSKKWKQINEEKLKDEIRQLYQSKAIEKRENPNGSYTMILTKKGRAKALTYYFDEIKGKKGNWDGKWRLLIFDIPEKKRKRRDILRNKLKSFGFHELQKSVFIFPYECEDEINFIIEFFNLRKYARFAILDSIDNELHLKKIFKLK